MFRFTRTHHQGATGST